SLSLQGCISSAITRSVPGVRGVSAVGPSGHDTKKTQPLPPPDDTADHMPPNLTLQVQSSTHLLHGDTERRMFRAGDPGNQRPNGHFSIRERATCDSLFWARVS